VKPAGAEPRTERLVAADLASTIQSVIGNDLVAIYLTGSSVTGGFDPGVSDLDLVVVTTVPPERLDLSGLERMHATFAQGRPDWRDRIETVYVGRTTLRSFRTSSDHLAVISPGEPFHVRDDHPGLWLQNWYLAREFGVALVGPAATEVVPRISWPEFVAATARYAAEVAARLDDDLSPGELAYVVLTTCRAVTTIKTDHHVSKQEAAAWVRERIPDSARTIAAALQCRLSHGAVGFDDVQGQAAARALVHRLAREIGAS
jgi:aminoglycoside adenylyltransferase-like protein/nucleotidyltransferase-like protein